jgi:hypothetical protein
MSAQGIISNLNIGDVDPIQRLGRKALLQFVALDYCIHIQSKVLAAAIVDGLLPNVADPLFDSANDFLKNPYKLDSNMIIELTNYVSFPRSINTYPDEIMRVFRDYYISISMQQILSHVLVNTQRIVDLQYVELENISGTSESYGTTDQIDSDILDYYRDIRNSHVKEELETSNSGTPLKGEYEEIIIKFIESIADLSNLDLENLLQNNMNYVVDELERERILLTNVFPFPTIPAVSLLQPDVLNSNTNEIVKNNLDNHMTTYTEIFRLAGLTEVINIFDAYLPNDIVGIVNSDIFSSILDYWGHLFTESQPVIINTLTTTLPKISEKFVTTVTPSISQQDLRYNCLRLMIDYLQKTIRSIRLDEMQNISEKPTAANSVVLFRSLRAMTDGLIKPVPATKLLDPTWTPDGDLTGRLGYMFNCLWVLSAERELNTLFKFAYDVIYASNPAVDPYGLGSQSLGGLKVIPAAVFPGSLDSSSALENSKSLIDLDFENDKRRIKIKEEKMKRSGELEKVMMNEGGRRLI